MPGCAFGSLITFSGYYKALFDIENGGIEYSNFINPTNTSFCVCSGGNFLYPAFNGQNPQDLWGPYLDPKNITTDTSNKIMGLLLESYNVFDSIVKDNLLSDIFKNQKLTKKQIWDQTVKEWFDKIEQRRNSNSEEKANFMSMVAGVEPNLRTDSLILYRYLLFNNLNDMGTSLYVQDIKNEKTLTKPSLEKINQEIDYTLWASSAMGIFSAAYIVSGCPENSPVNKCFAPFADCQECQSQLDKIEKDESANKKNIGKKLLIWNLIKNKILESAKLNSLYKFKKEKIFFTDGGVMDVNATIFNVINKSENLLIFNINQCNGLKSYFKEKGDDSFCFLDTPIFAEKEWDKMSAILTKNFEKTGVEYGILENIEVIKNKRFGITPYIVQKMFVINLTPTLSSEKKNISTSELFFKSKWYNDLSEEIKNYIKLESGTESKNKGFFLENGCNTSSKDKYIPKKLDAILVSNFCAWQMRTMLNDELVQEFFKSSLN